MKNLALVLFMFAGISAFAQGEASTGAPDLDIPNETFFFDIGTVLWDHNVAGLTTEPQSYHIGLNLYKEFAASRYFAMASGLGISWNNVYTNLGVTADRANNRLMYDLIGDSIDYNRNKLVATYLDIPLELRFRTKENAKGNFFRFHVGAKAGIRLSGYSKYVTDEFKTRTHKVKSFSMVRYGLQGRIGFGGTSLYVFYPLNKVFDTEDIALDGINDIQAITVGLTFSK